MADIHAIAQEQLPESWRTMILDSVLEASILAGPLTINTKATVNQVAVLLRRTAEELIDAKIVEAPKPGAAPVTLERLEPIDRTPVKSPSPPAAVGVPGPLGEMRGV